ncbi:MAG: hypothetical protein A3C55_03500 [Gammaproteobacteria bacterium RIFCSPHIGHO2_02_FULL_42_13]|nr:MAG: hypothetical protein A3C55_03500 [Gammaproteobacteria bacterium RIFCSPHIGHO2_02_FULL_42_13]OGT70471.1 MAG: hypothetical protein A3H43_00080 [Gammaproteobacteria bacterium RIFCSPLOWO2_02_FULL_42_9]
MKLAIVCGGPSLERGISLNSARSLLDHLYSDQIEIVPFYLDHNCNAYKISRSQLYSNTPSDFDFKLYQTATPLTESEFIRDLKETDLVFPAMHGAFGEDGTFQTFLETNNIPFIGCDAATCRRVFDKFTANELIKKLGFFTLPSTVLTIDENNHHDIIKTFFAKHNISRAIIKPAKGGSSIGVFSVETIDEAADKTKFIFDSKMDTRVVIEPFAKGIEFTVIILHNQLGLPVAILPTEIETDYTEHQIFDFRKKYLPSRQVTYHCPPRFNNETIEKIQVQAEQLFSILGFRDFARFDGWLLSNGHIWFSDFNPISGMEQNSFLFQQASRIGLTHADVLKHIVHRACDRYQIPFPLPEKTATSKRKPIHVLFGGNTSERQVSVMSGTNVWLKLRASTRYEPTPFLLDVDGNVWQVPYHLALNHTVEEITQSCKYAQTEKERLEKLEQKVRSRLAIDASNANEFYEPKQFTLDEFIKSSPFVFIGLHGGIGENGELQKKLMQQNVKFNGSNSEISALCINKADTSNAIKQLNLPGIQTIPHVVMSIDQCKYTWQDLCQQLDSKTIIAKPISDGCSSGVVHLYDEQDFQTYVRLIKNKVAAIMPHTFKHQPQRIELSPIPTTEILFERFIETDIIFAKGKQLQHQPKTGWLETTVGVIQENNNLKAFNPSITIAEGEVLSVEEKFQGGTGINITPPPENIIKSNILNLIKEHIELLANKIGLEGYARIDAFMHVQTGDLIIIEINTLPGLTPSTVLYQQALAENPKLYPRQLLEQLIENKKYL